MFYLKYDEQYGLLICTYKRDSFKSEAHFNDFYKHYVTDLSKLSFVKTSDLSNVKEWINLN